MSEATPMDDRDPIAQQMRGRAEYLRTKNAVKDPDLFCRGAAEIDRLQARVREMEEALEKGKDLAKEAFREAQSRYPQAIPALVFLWAALGLGFIKPDEETVQAALARTGKETEA
jgi:aspartate/methionine/tyrosine aminotransferase